MVEDGGKFRNYLLFPFDSLRRFEMYSIEVDCGGELAAEAHPQGTEEFIAVFSGEISIDIGGENFAVADIIMRVVDGFRFLYKATDSQR